MSEATDQATCKGCKRPTDPRHLYVHGYCGVCVLEWRQTFRNWQTFKALEIIK